jgi:AcrR family transcriptional regulator
MASAADTVLHRRLSGAQLEKRIRIVQSGIELARERGYDGFSTRDVAKRADVALGTIYNNFTSKDHLLAEALLEWLAEFLYERMAIRASSEPELYEALRRAMMSSDGSVESARRAHMEGARRWFELAIGSGPVGDADTLIEVLEYLVVGAFLITPGSDDPKPLIDRLERSVRFIASRV